MGVHSKVKNDLRQYRQKHGVKAGELSRMLGCYVNSIFSAEKKDYLTTRSYNRYKRAIDSLSRKEFIQNRKDPQALKRYRKKRQVTQEQVNIYLNRSPGYLTYIENHMEAIDSDEYDKIIHAIDRCYRNNKDRVVYSPEELMNLRENCGIRRYQIDKVLNKCEGWTRAKERKKELTKEEYELIKKTIYQEVEKNQERWKQETKEAVAQKKQSSPKESLWTRMKRRFNLCLFKLKTSSATFKIYPNKVVVSAKINEGLAQNYIDQLNRGESLNLNVQQDGVEKL